MELKDTDKKVVAGKAPGSMKLAFIEVRYNKEITLPTDFLEKIPKKVILFTNIQYHPQYDAIKAQLEAKGIEVHRVRPKHAWEEGQILGCSVEDWSAEDVEGFVYIGDGFFHPKALLFNNEQPVFMYDPEHDEQYTLTQKDIESILKRRKGAYATFLTSTEVGVLITSKYGQNRLKESFSLEEKFPDKKFYYLMADQIDFDSLQDFNFIQVFVNTACPRIMDDHDKIFCPVINIQELTKQEW